MKINFICIESSRPEWAQKAFQSYESKFNKSININWIGVKPLNRNKNYNVSDIVQRESALLSSKLKKNDFVITLDKEGQSLSTEKLRFHFVNSKQYRNQDDDGYVFTNNCENTAAYRIKKTEKDHFIYLQFNHKIKKR